MDTLIKHYFPLFKSSINIMKEIYGNKQLKQVYDSWGAKQQSDFLSLCAGIQGEQIFSDTFLKATANFMDTTRLLQEIMDIFSKSLKGSNQVFSPKLPELEPDPFAGHIKRDQRLKKQLETQHRQTLSLLFALFRHKIPTPVSLETYASLLDINISTLEQIYKKVQEKPDTADAELFALI